MTCDIISVVIPTYNGATRIGSCLKALQSQDIAFGQMVLDILVVNDGSTDDTENVVGGFPGVRVINQPNSGPAAARNRGASAARGSIVLFTDDDCVPTKDWLRAMLEPFVDGDVVGAKGVYRTDQRSLAARFVQIEYEDKYRLMRGAETIDFVDTYSAAFRRARFMEMNGYDTSFPVACAEDIELSYRMSSKGWRMRFAPEAVVYHSHPATLSSYLRKKYKFAFWRVLAVKKNPAKGIRDSHTPQIMKIQLFLAPALLLSVAIDVVVRPEIPYSAVILATFVLSSLPFAIRAFAKDPAIGIISPAMLAARACVQVVGVAAGLIYARGKSQAEYDKEKSIAA